MYKRQRLGRLAAYIRDSRIPLEMCPSSNLQTGAARSIGRLMRDATLRDRLIPPDPLVTPSSGMPR